MECFDFWLELSEGGGVIKWRWWWRRRRRGGSDDVDEEKIEMFIVFK